MIKKTKKYNFSRKKHKKSKFSNKKPKRAHRKLFLKLFTILILFLLQFYPSFKYLFFEKFYSKNKTKVCLCVIAKKENLYIEYFIYYYKQLGFDHIYLYDNNDKNGEKMEDIIKKYIDEGFVTLINYRGLKGGKNNPQMRAYYECYEKYNTKYDWISFFDIDEYLMLKPKGIKIQKFLENKRYKDCPLVKINWLMFSDNGQLNYEKKPIIKRFPNPSHNQKAGIHVKSIMRGNISCHKLAKTYNPHYLYYDIKSCSSSGKFVEGTCFNDPPDYEYATLNHYPKTITEYIEKLKRGFFSNNPNLNHKRLNRKFNVFFEMNNKTEEKIKIFNDAFKTNFK